ncbi:Polycomb protein PHO, partial [Frankliniella fusca]
MRNSKVSGISGGYSRSKTKQVLTRIRKASKTRFVLVKQILSTTTKFCLINFCLVNMSEIMAYLSKSGCTVRFSSPLAYRSHLKLHSPVFACPIAICASKFTSKASLDVNLSRDHKRSKRRLEPSADFKCPYNATVVEYFRTHVSRAHPKTRSGVESTSTSREIPSEQHATSGVCDDSNSPNGRTVSHSQVHGEESTSEDSEDNEGEDTVSNHEIKREYGKFYLRLESEFILPSSTVQVIAERIRRTIDLTHQCLKRKMRAELEVVGVDDATINSMISKVFKSDTVYNIHHKFEDFDQLGTHHLRQKFWKNHFPYVEPKQIYLGNDVNGKKKYAHYFSIRESLTQMIMDPEIKAMILQSFEIEPQDASTFTSSKIFSDFTDGSEFAEHMKKHPGKKCLLLFLFQDAFDFTAFGPSQGTYKSLGFYYALGNIKSECRTKLGCFQMVYLCLEKYFKATLEEDLNEVDKLKAVLKPLLDELVDLRLNGIEVDGEIIPVCLMFGLGDNAGQHFIGRYNPTECKPFRTPAEYDEAVQIAHEKWIIEKEKALDFRRRRRVRMMNRGDVTLDTTNKLEKPISKSAHKKLCSIHHEGVKYIPCPLNSDVLQFHCSSPSLVVCLAHDFFEGVVKSVLPAILKHFSDENWFDLELLNRRIKSFKCEGNDLTEALTPLKSFDSLGGNASENWTLFRNLPFLLEDLIQDKEDKMWCLYLQLKEIVELVAAPKITLQQVLYLRVLIREYLTELSKLLPEHLVPKQHYLLHYPDLILKYGPLIRLFTLRFESKHVFFKNVAKACKNYINITYTLSRKHACKFALDHSNGLLPPAISFNAGDSMRASDVEWSDEVKSAFHPMIDLEKINVVDWVEVHGVRYRTHDRLQLGLLNICDLQVGSIEAVLIDVNNNVGFLVKQKNAMNSFSGYYKVYEQQATNYKVITYEDLVDYYPIPVYKHSGRDCFTLKHSAPF